ncbi:MAG: GNAT family N-acetyltransferase [Chloroflexi bacterium]|nr:GNAT family N-acetyltransferase [Chloroflexota bacterium]
MTGSPPNPELTVRAALPDDLDAVVEIALAAWQPIYAEYQRLLGAELYASLHADWRARKAEQVRSACLAAFTAHSPATAHALVAVLDGRVVGFATFATDPATGVGVLTNNAVAPASQGRGIASQLYARALALMRAAGMRHARVTTGGDAAHAPARRAYEKAGFVAMLSSVDYYRKL